MRAWIWIAMVVMACGKGGQTDCPTTPAGPTVTSKVIDGIRVLRIDRSDGPTLFVRADAIGICGTGTAPCRPLIEGCPGPDCMPTSCPCEKVECKRYCMPPHDWPHDADLVEIVRNHGVVDPPPPITPASDPPPPTTPR